MVRIALAACLVAITAGGASAQIDGSTVSLSCGQAAGIVRARGAAVLGTGGATYDRFVSSRRFCQITEAVRPAFVPTRDNRACFVGYTCYEPSRDDWFGSY